MFYEKYAIKLINDKHHNPTYSYEPLFDIYHIIFIAEMNTRVQFSFVFLQCENFDSLEMKQLWV